MERRRFKALPITVTRKATIRQTEIRGKANFTSPAAFATLHGGMQIQKTMSLLLLALLLGGCSTTSITNLTPRQLPRNANGIYPFEVALDTNQQTLRQETIKPYVLVGTRAYPMQSALMLRNRWEALIPIPATNKFVSYRYKFDYNYNRFGDRGANSRLSQQYQVEITEK